MANIGSRLRELRLQKKMTMREVAELAGIAQSSLSYIEAGSNSPSIDTLEAILKALGSTMADFFSQERSELTPEIRRMVDTAKKLTPEQRESILRLLETMGKE